MPILINQIKETADIAISILTVKSCVFSASFICIKIISFTSQCQSVIVILLGESLCQSVRKTLIL